MTTINKQALPKAGALRKTWTAVRITAIGTEAEWALLGARKGSLWNWALARAQGFTLGAGVALIGLLGIAAIPQTVPAQWMLAAARDAACLAALPCAPIEVAAIRADALSMADWRSAAERESREGSAVLAQLFSKAADARSAGAALITAPAGELSTAMGAPLSAAAMEKNDAIRRRLFEMRARLAAYRQMEAGMDSRDAESLARGHAEAAEAADRNAIERSAARKALLTSKISTIPASSLRSLVAGSDGDARMAAKAWLAQQGLTWPVAAIALWTFSCLIAAQAAAAAWAFVGGIAKSSAGLDRVWSSRQVNAQRMRQWKKELRDKRKAQALARKSS